MLHVVDHWAAHRPQAPALITADGTVWSYEAVQRRLRNQVAALVADGVGPGDRVLVAPGGDVESAIALMALMSCAVACPIGPHSPVAEMLVHAKAVGAGWAMLAGSATDQVRSAAERLGLPIVGRHPDRDTRGDVVVEGEPAADSDVLLLRTSGTTGAAKSVPLTAANVLAGARASAKAYHLSPDDRRLNFMPMHHVQGIVGSLLASLVAGASVVLADHFDAAQVLAELGSGQVSWFSATPAMYRTMLEAGAASGAPYPGLRFVRAGSSSLLPNLRAEIEKAFKVTVVESYGMSEAHQIASTPLTPDSPRLGMVPTGSMVGMFCDGRVRTDPGASGEIVISGPNVSRGESDDPAVRQQFVGSWWRTGDQGRICEDGSIVVSGRIRDLIDRGGEKIPPREVEEAIAEHPAVGQVAVFGVPDPVLGESVIAAVVPREQAEITESALRQFLSGRISPQRIPRRLIIRDELPMNATGKIQRAILAETLAEEIRRSAGGPTTIGGEPESALAAALCGLWAYVLRNRSLGVEDDFFLAGGDSISAALLIRMVEECFGVRIASLELYDDVYTVARMERLVRQRRDAGRLGGR